MKFTPDVGIGLKFDMIYFFRKIDISMVTINRKTRYQLNLNSMRIRFDVEKLTPVSVNFGVLHSKYTRMKKFCMFDFE